MTEERASTALQALRAAISEFLTNGAKATGRKAALRRLSHQERADLAYDLRYIQREVQNCD